MNITGKLIFTLVAAAAMGGTGYAARKSIGLPGTTMTSTIQLAKVVVTPANAEPETIVLAPIVVRPTEVDFLYAETRGVKRLAKAITRVSGFY